jgi:hypothetical protein
MSWRTRIPGKFGRFTTGNTDRQVNPYVTPWRSVDVLDGSWTLSTQAGNIVSLTTSTAGMEITQDISLDNSNWNQNAHTADRYYRKLAGPDGDLTWGDIFTLEILVERTAQGDEDRAGIVLGLSDESVHTGTSNIEWIGLQAYNRNNNAGMIMRIGSGAGNAEVEDAAGVKAYAFFSPAIDDTDVDSDVQQRRANGLLLNTNGELLKSGGMPENAEEFDSSQNVYLFFSPHYRNTTSKTNNSVDTWKVWYRFTTNPSGLSPTYIPNAGNNPFAGFSE